MRPFKFYAPRSLDEALAVLAQHGDDARPLSGGTGLIHFLKQELVQPAALVSLGHVPGLDSVRVADGRVHVGALVRQRQMETSADLAGAVPLLTATYGHVATVRIREAATVGGGLGQGDPAQDPPASWVALGATVTLQGADGTREVPAGEFWVDYYTTAVRAGEIVTAVSAPLPAPGTGWSYQKFLPRSADDYAAVSVACLLALDPDGTIASVRLGIGACAPTPVACPAVGQGLVGQLPDEALFAEAAQAVREVVDPLDDVRGSADYKRDMAVVFTRRALVEAARRARAH